MLRPRLIVLQPTPYCNINCSYCYLGHRDDRRLMPMAVIDGVREKIFRKLAPDAAPSVVWHAGEPTMAPIEWYDDAYAIDRRFSVKHKLCDAIKWARDRRQMDRLFSPD
jgi:uncharacterized protein